MVIQHTLLKLTKNIRPKSFIEKHQAIGWCLNVLLDEFYKDLLSVKSVNIKNNDEFIFMEAIILVTVLIADNETLEGKIQEMKKHYFLSGGFVMTKRLDWTWDDIEILESIGDKNEQ